MISAAQLFIDGIRKREGGSAGRINLPVMVLFHDFNIKTGFCQNGGRLLQQILEQVDSKGHIRRLENGRLFGNRIYPCELFFGKAGGAQHAGRFRLLTEGKQIVHRFCRGKIHDDIRLLFRLFLVILQTLIDRVGMLSARKRVNTGHRLKLLIRFGKTAYHLAHMPITAMY